MVAIWPRPICSIRKTRVSALIYEHRLLGNILQEVFGKVELSGILLKKLRGFGNHPFVKPTACVASAMPTSARLRML
jgi:hypothetical protein